MTAVLLGIHEPNTEPWYELRAGGLGGSEIAAVVGLSPYMSPFWLWHFKKGNIPGQKVNSAMDWGHRLEPVVREWFAERHEFDVVPTPGTYANAERPWQRCNPDGLIYDDEFLPEPIALYEGKTARYADDWGPSGSDQIPLKYACQIQHSLDVFGLPRAYLAVLIGGSDAREYVIEADPEDQRLLREAGERFWQSLQTDDEPPIDCSDSTYQAVRDLNPLIDKDADIEIGALWDEYDATKAQRDHHEAELTGVKARILAAMGTARIATHNTIPVLRRQMSSAGTPYLKEIA